MGIRISKDHLHPSVIESITSLIGDLNQLETTAKGNAVEAINELLANGGNKEELEALIAEIAEGKELIANAIGEPLSKDDTFQAMSSDINSLLSTFKTNMMNNGITVEINDRFKQLIDKIATMVEEGSSKGIQYAEGVSNIGKLTYNSSGVTHTINANIEFKPSYMFAVLSECPAYGNVRNNTTISSFEETGSSASYITYISSMDETSFTIFMKGPQSYTTNNAVDIQWYAIGVGEEDTTLRDSLASILQEEGVSVTEEDTMASLITKVDEEFDRKNNQEYQFDANQEGYPVDILTYTDKIVSSSTTWAIFKQETLPLSGIFKCETGFKKLGTKASPASVRLGVVDTNGVETFYDTFSQSSTNGTTIANWIIDIQRDSTINFYGMVESAANTLSIHSVSISTNVVCN